MHGAPGITNPELPSSAVLVAAACVLASTSVFARGGLGHGGGFANRGGFVRQSYHPPGITSTADARFPKPDSGPTRGTFAAVPLCL